MGANKIVRMLEAILSTKDRELTCHELDENLLARYAELELSGETPGEHLPRVEHHLALCPDCRRDYAEVREVLRLEREGQWIEPTAQPVFDLSFLTRPEGEVGLWAQVGPRLRRYVDRVPALLLPQLEQLGRLPRGLQLSYAPAVPLRMRGSQAEATAVSFQLRDTEERLQIQVGVSRVGERAVWITVRPVDAITQQPLTRASVGLFDELGRPLEIRALRPGGLVQFREVAIGREYALRIVQDQQTWEIPFDLREES